MSEKQIQDSIELFKNSYSKSGENVHDQVTNLLSRLLINRPRNAIDIVDYSIKSNHANDFNNSQWGKESIKCLFKYDQYDTHDVLFSNFLENSFYFEQAGIGLNSDETYKIFLALRKLSVMNPSIENVRFWGKIFGTEKNYYIAQAKLTSNVSISKNVGLCEENRRSSLDLSGVDSVPQIEYSRVVIPIETNFGCNSYQYFACNSLSEDWTCLPPVSPQEIQLAREFKRYLSGHLDAPVLSNPKFNGLEVNYLRAQIARITATTHISPVGYFNTLNDEQDELSNDPETKPLKIFTQKQLLSKSNWVHHEPYILQQGTTQWCNPIENESKESDDDDTSKNDDSNDRKLNEFKNKPQVGPHLFTSIENDDDIDDEIPAWTIFRSFKIMSKFSITCLRSNLWPGAYTFANENNFDNIYIGWGQKYAIYALNPYPQPIPQSEYDDHSLIEEIEPLKAPKTQLKYSEELDQDFTETGTDDEENLMEDNLDV